MDKTQADILLSICIPTFNRANILEKTLDAYINDPAFDDRIEIIISDNCSTDSTREVAEKFTRKFANISYYCNSENIKDLNFTKALSLGSGQYLKLMNDTVTLKNGSLKYMLDRLSLNRDFMKPVFFYQNIPFLNSNCAVCCSNLNELVSNVSFGITWIVNFGIWQKDFISLENKNRLAHLQFVQADWTLRIIKNNTNGIIHFGDYYNVAELKNKGGYNVFKTFVENYLSVFDEYKKSGHLFLSTLRKEKFRLFKHYLIPVTVDYLTSTDTKYTFETKGGFKILFKNYWYFSYFYVGLIKFGILLCTNNPIIRSSKTYQKIKSVIKKQIRFFLD